MIIKNIGRRDAKILRNRGKNAVMNLRSGVMIDVKSSGNAGRMSRNDVKTGERILENIEKNVVMTLRSGVMIDVNSSRIVVRTSGNNARTGARILENTEKNDVMILVTVVRIDVEMCRSVEMVERITVVRARGRGIKAEGLKMSNNWFNIEK